MQPQETSFLDRFKFRMARTAFKRHVRKFTDAMSAEDLEQLAEIPGSVAKLVARQPLPPAPAPEAKLSPEQRYIYEMGLSDYLDLIAEVSPQHAEVLRRHPAFAGDLMQGIASILIKK